MKFPIPAMMDWYRQSQAKDYFINTPSTFSIYFSQLMCSHMLEMGGLPYYEKLASRKSKLIYDTIEKS